jgi:hypothetical protein
VPEISRSGALGSSSDVLGNCGACGDRGDAGSGMSHYVPVSRRRGSARSGQRGRASSSARLSWPIDGLPQRASPVMQEIFQAVRDLMVMTHDMSMREAQGRIVAAFEGKDCTSEATEDLVAHRDVDYWVSHVYYGPDALWQAKLGIKPTPEPWP